MQLHRVKQKFFSYVPWNSVFTDFAVSLQLSFYTNLKQVNVSCTIKFEPSLCALPIGHDNL